MPALLDLPDELLAQILSRFDPTLYAWDALTLQSLCLTCRRLCTLAQPLLFRHTEFYLSGYKPTFKRIQLFLRSCSANKFFIDEVQSASLQAQASWFFEGPNTQCLEQLVSCWAGSKTLRKLRLAVDDLADLETLIPVLELGRSCFPCLSDLDLDTNVCYSRGNTMSLFTKLCMTPGLEKLALYGSTVPSEALQDGLSEAELVEDGTIASDLSSTVHTLQIEGAYIYENMLMSLLLRAPRLQHLTISPIFINSEDRDLWHEDDELPTSAVLSPVKLNQLLLPVQNQLEQLTILDLGEMNSSHDGTQLDLAGFACLKTLTLSNACLFGGCTSAIEAPSIRHLLPPTLEYLTIAFPRKAGVLYTLGEMKSALLIGNDAWNRLWLQRTSWGLAHELQMLNLVIDTMRPNRLKSLMLLEDNSCGWRSRFTKVIRWRVNEISCPSGVIVNFVVELRVPERWQTELEVIKYWAR